MFIAKMEFYCTKCIVHLSCMHCAVAIASMYMFTSSTDQMGIKGQIHTATGLSLKFCHARYQTNLCPSATLRCLLDGSELLYSVCCQGPSCQSVRWVRVAMLPTCVIHPSIPSEHHPRTLQRKTEVPIRIGTITCCQVGATCRRHKQFRAHIL